MIVIQSTTSYPSGVVGALPTTVLHFQVFFPQNTEEILEKYGIRGVDFSRWDDKMANEIIWYVKSYAVTIGRKRARVRDMFSGVFAENKDELHQIGDSLVELLGACSRFPLQKIQIYK